ncbi:hypothetical protein JW979_02630 [bacterium]|nr:hypothetical protein [candidate division CSSED10-310 bacterium]
MKLFKGLVFAGILMSSFVYANNQRYIPLFQQSTQENSLELEVHEFPDHLSITLKLPGFSVSRTEHGGMFYDQLGINGGGLKGETGSPYLPFKGFFAEVPSGVSLSVTAVVAEEVDVEGSYRVIPRQLPQIESNASENPDFTINENVYSTNAFLPEKQVEITRDGFIRGRRVIFLEISPVRYNPIEKKLKAAQSMTFDIEFQGKADAGQNERKARLYSAAFEQQAHSLLVNYSPVDARDKDSSKNGADYLIIAHDDYVDELAPLVEWKTLKGYETTLVTLSDIGGSTSQIILDYLMNVYNSWNPVPTYVLLVGDYNQVISCTVSPDAYGYAFPSDLPYSLLDGSDYFPDIFMGRLSVNNEGACNTVVNKIITYDRTPEVASWYHSALIAAYFQDDYSPYCEADRWFFETGTHVMQYLESTLGMNIFTAMCTSASGCSQYHFRSDSYPHRPDYPDPVPQVWVDMITSSSQASLNITQAFNTGIGLVQHRDHGEELGWSDPPFYVSNVNQLENGNRTPVVFSINCLTGAFDYSSDCFAEALQKKSGGGAVGVVAATRVSYSGFNDLLCHGTYTGFFPDYDSTHSGNLYNHAYSVCEALNFGKYYMYMYEGDNADTLYTFRLFHWFGDPEMMIRTDVPSDPDIELPSTIPAGTMQVTIPISNDNARVSILQENTLLGSALSSGGYVTIPLNQAIVGGVDVTLVVTGYNLNPLETTVLSEAPSCGILQLTSNQYNCDTSATVKVIDADLNLDPGNLDEVSITVSSTSDPSGISVFCTEIEPDLAIFEGVFQTYATGGSGDLLVSHNDIITAFYHDEYCDGGPVDVTDTASVDCQPPQISGLIISGITTESVTVTWMTDEPADTKLIWGESIPPDQTEYSPLLTTAHEVVLEELDPCTDYYFLVSGTDIAQNVAIDDNGGSYYQFTTYQEILFLEANMDANPGWTCEGQWEWGQPTGSQGDPSSGYTGNNVMGYNLNGDYANNIPAYYVTTPAFDCSMSSEVFLGYWKWLGVESSSYDHASVEVSNNGGTDWHVVWEHSGASVDPDSWSYSEHDISQWAAGQSDVKLRWGMGPSDGMVTYCGWNIDDVVVSYTTPCNVPVLTYETHAIDDSAGNNNGEINAGETIVMSVTLENMGLDATGIYAELSTTNSNVTIINDSASFPDIPQSGTGTSLSDFTFDVNNAVEDGDTIPFTLAWFSNETSGSTSFADVISAPVLACSETIVMDSDGDADGIIDPGETVQLLISLDNSGSGIAQNISAVLSSDHPQYITIDDDYAEFPDLPGGGSGACLSPHYTLTANGSIPDHTMVTFTLNISADSYSISDTFLMEVTQSTFAQRYYWPMDSDPGWVCEGDWEFGQPQGNDGDPSSGYTGTNVYGYNLAGDYSNSMPETNLTSSPINCSNLTNVEVRFMRWLGVESASYDHASFRVSTNGTTWQTVWNHTGGSFTDPDWQALSYDISSIADGQSTVYLRWVMGTTDYSVTYCGWNIDDVAIWAESSAPVPTPTPPQPTNTPFATHTTIPTNTAIPTNTPIPTYTFSPTPTFTPPPPPTHTAQPKPSVTPPPATPTPSPTQTIPDKGIRLVLDDNELEAGDTFHLHMFLYNPDPYPYDGDVYVLLQITDSYWCWPSWCNLNTHLDFTTYTIPARTIVTDQILQFTWPQNAGSGGPYAFIAAMFSSGTWNLVGDVQIENWTYY